MKCPKCGSEMNPSWIDDKDWDYAKDDYREPDWWICDCGHEEKVKDGGA